MHITISNIIILCALQTLGLLVILSQRKFKSPSNNILKLILISLLIYYAYYYLFLGEVELYQYIPLFLSFTIASPPIIYFYCISVMKGKAPSFRTIYPHLILPLYSLVWSYFVLEYGSLDLQDFTLKASMAILGLLHLIYPLFVIFKLSNIYQLKGVERFRVFKYNKEKTVMMKLFIIMMLIHSVLLNLRTILFIFESQSWYTLEILNIVFLLVLSYLIAYSIITIPTGVHTSGKKIGITGFKSYEKSGLSQEKAHTIATKLNKLCIEDKVFLDSDMNLQKMSSLINEPPHQVTETLNRLLGQRFSEYLNNFRVEEFKNLLKQPIYQKYSILALGMEVGFNSKATFNAAFKKFTQQTPSEYKAALTKQTQAK